MQNLSLKQLLNSYFGIIRRFIPQTPVGTSVGVDIGGGECKLVEIRKIDDKFELVNWGSELISNGEAAPVIGKLLGRLTHSPKTIYTSLSGKGTLIRFIELPRMPLDQLRSSFALEADKYFPFPPDRIYTDCSILNPSSKSRQMNVIAAAARKEMIDERMKLLQGLGMTVDFISLNAVVLANVIKSLGTEEFGSEAGALALLDMGEIGCNLTILNDGLQGFARDIFIGGMEFTRRLSNAFGIDAQEAIKLRDDPGEKMEEVLAVYETAVQNLIREIRLSFDYFSTEKDKEIQKVLLTGGGALIPGIASVLENNLGIKVMIWNPLTYLTLAPALSETEIRKTGMKYGVALGLALSDYD